MNNMRKLSFMIGIFFVLALTSLASASMDYSYNWRDDNRYRDSYYGCGFNDCYVDYGFYNYPMMRKINYRSMNYGGHYSSYSPYSDYGYSSYCRFGDCAYQNNYGYYSNYEPMYYDWHVRMYR